MYPSDDDGYVRAETIQQAARSHVQRAIVTPAEIELCPELANSVEKLHFYRGWENFRAVQEQLQFLAEGVAKFRLLTCGTRS